MIPATGGDSRPQTYGLTDAHTPAAADLTYRLLEIDLSGRENVLAEATVEAGLTTGIARPATGLSLNLLGTPKANVIVETAEAVEGPWTRAQTLTLDRGWRGNGEPWPRRPRTCRVLPGVERVSASGLD